jgi:uncharacterized membrane protein YdjX (TVP38/TMEM64 family)
LLYNDGMKIHASTLRRLAILLGVMAAIVLFWRFTGLHEIFLEFVVFLEKVARRSGPGGMLAFLTLSTFASSIGPFTVVPLVPSAVRVWGVPTTAFLMMFGGLLGATLTYTIGRFAGERVLKLFVRPARLARWKETVPKRAAFFMALAIKFALPAEVGYAFGIVRFGLLKYLLVTFISYVPIIAAIIWGSRAFVEGRLGPLLASISIIGLMSAGAGYYLTRHQRSGGIRRWLARFRRG